MAHTTSEAACQLPSTLAAERITATRGQQRDGSGRAGGSGQSFPGGTEELLETVKALSSPEIITKPTEEGMLKGIYKGAQTWKLKFRYKREHIKL